MDEGSPLFAHGIDSGDFNGDPYPDLAIAAFYVNFESQQFSLSGLVAAVSGKSDGTFLTRPDGTCFPFDTLESQTVNVMVADLDADGFDDVVAANHTINADSNKFTISVLINGIQATSIIFADWNYDGLTDTRDVIGFLTEWVAAC